MKLKINNLKVVQDSRIITKKKFKAYIRVTLINVLSLNPIQPNNSQLVTQSNFLLTCRPMDFIRECFINARCNVQSSSHNEIFNQFHMKKLNTW